MTGLSDVYGSRVGALASGRRLSLGLVCFALGVLLVSAGIVIATTAAGAWLGLGTYGARELGGILAGLGLPAAFLGVFSLLPASRRSRAAAIVGAALAVLGVTLFHEFYPRYWIGSPATPDLTVPVLGVYALGVTTTFWCLFVAAASFKTRNDPGGTVTMEVTEAGRVRVVEASGSVPGLGGVGWFGADPDGSAGVRSGAGDDARSRRDAPSSAPASDGGSATRSAGADAPAGDEEFLEAARTRGRPDAYCGNCAQFQYVRIDGGDLAPFCTLHEELLEDMDACEEWQPNS